MPGAGGCARAERFFGIGFLVLALVGAVAPQVHAQDVTADEYEVNGTLTVSPSGALLQGYSNATSGYSANAGLVVGGLLVNGAQVGTNGTILNGVGVREGDNAVFSNLTTGNIVLGGGLGIGGTLYIQNSLQLGAWSDGSVVHSGLALGFVDDGNAHSGQVYLTSAAPQTTWSWAPFHGLATLDPNGNFSLTDNVSGNTVTMVPGNFSFVLSHNGSVVATVPVGNIPAANTIFASDGTVSVGGGNIVVEGAGSSPGVILGNYTVGTNPGGSALVLSAAGSNGTVSLDAGSQAVVFSSGFWLGGGSSLTKLGLGNLGLALGGSAAASAPGAMAIGGTANASGLNSLALAGGVASGNGAFSAGSGSVAGGDNSLALAGGQASGLGTVALGAGTVAQTWGATVVGHYNLPASGNATAWSAADPAFVVGGGANSTAPANALVISNNGTTTLNGNTTLTDANHQVQVNGASTFNGTVTFGGNLTLPQPLGDIPMGPFGAH